MTPSLTLAAGMAEYLPGILVVVFMFVCIVLILTVLIQRPQGGGLSGAFGSGAGSGQTAFGAKTGDALTIATIAIFVLYLLVAIGLNYVVRPRSGLPVTPAAVGTSPAPATTGQPAQPAGQPAATPPAGSPQGPAPAPAGGAPQTGAPQTGAPAQQPQPVAPPTPAGETGGEKPSEPQAKPADNPAPAPAPATPPGR